MVHIVFILDYVDRLYVCMTLNTDRVILRLTHTMITASKFSLTTIINSRIVVLMLPGISVPFENMRCLRGDVMLGSLLNYYLKLLMTSLRKQRVFSSGTEIPGTTSTVTAMYFVYGLKTSCR